MPEWIKPIGLLGFAGLFGYMAWRNIQSAKLKPSRFDRIYYRATDPGTFWFHVAVNIVVAIGFVIAAYSFATR